MNRAELRKWLLDNVFTKDGNNINSHIFRNKNREIYRELIQYTKELDPIKISFRVRAFLNGQDRPYNCIICGNPILIYSNKNPQIYCSTSCRNKGGIVKQKETFLKKYGVDNPMKDPNIRSKVSDTNMSRYGGTSPACDPLVLDKMKQTCQYRHGVDNPMRSSYIIAKVKKAKQVKYNSCNITTLSDNQLDILTDAGRLKTLYDMPMSSWDIADDLGVSPGTVIYYLNQHQIEWRDGGYSAAEKSFLDHIRSIYKGKLITNSREIIHPYEIDIYLPEYNIAIEYDGVYWHSSANNIPSTYHLTKTTLCEEKDIQLYHIFSSDDLNIWKSVISNMLGLSKIIYARRCSVNQVDYSTMRCFLETNHLQGPGSNWSHGFGLYHNSSLISVMTFCKDRYRSGYEYELLRFCTKMGYRVIGGASKLLKHSGIRSCVSYANRRWSNGRLYHALGFEYLGRTRPNYFYTKDFRILYSRVKFQKHKLKRLLQNYDSNLSEGENMAMNGYYRIYDCGQLKFIID